MSKTGLSLESKKETVEGGNVTQNPSALTYSTDSKSSLQRSQENIPLTQKTEGVESSQPTSTRVQKKSKKGFLFKIFLAIAGTTCTLGLLLTLTAFIISMVLYTKYDQQASELQGAQHSIQSLRQQLNELRKSLQNNVQVLEQHNDEVQNRTKRIEQFSYELQSHTQLIELKLNNAQGLIEDLVLPTYSCKDLPPGSPSGYYHITTSNGIIAVYCSNNLRNCSCNSNIARQTST